MIPFKGRAKDSPEPDDRPKNHVKALDERAGWEIRFPVVEGYVLDLSNPEIECDVAKVESLKIEPIQTPTTVFVMPQVGVRHGHVGSIDFETKEHDREEFYDEHHIQTIQFEAARQILMRLTDQQTGHSSIKMMSRQQLFPQILQVVEDYCNTRVDWSGQPKQELALEIYIKRLVGLLTDAIRPKGFDRRGKAPSCNKPIHPVGEFRGCQFHNCSPMLPNPEEPRPTR